MKTIAIDASKLSDPTKTGVESVVENLVKHILFADSTNQYLLYTPRPLADVWLRSKNVKERIVPPKKFWSSWHLGMALFKDKPDIFWQPSNILPIIVPRRTKTISTVHDLAPIVVSEAFSKQAFFAAIIGMLQIKSQATRLVAISESTKKDLIDLFGIKSKRITVIPNAAASPNSQAIEPFAMHFEHYFLFVGRVEVRKNLLRIIRAFAEFKKTDTKQTYLVLAGKPGFGYQKVLDEMTRCGVHPYVIVTGYMPQNTLESLWQKAIALVFPTLHEGFGIPILEAFDRSVPVLTGNIGATAEVAGEAAYLVDPQNEKEISRALRDLATDKELRAELIARGRKRAEHYSWESSAVGYIELWKTL